MTADTRACKPLTLADLCQAIEDHEVSHAVRDGQYELTALDLRRLQRDRQEDEAYLDIAIDALIAADAHASEMGTLA